MVCSDCILKTKQMSLDTLMAYCTGTYAESTNTRILYVAVMDVLCVLHHVVMLLQLFIANRVLSPPTPHRPRLTNVYRNSSPLGRPEITIAAR